MNQLEGDQELDHVYTSGTWNVWVSEKAARHKQSHEEQRAVLSEETLRSLEDLEALVILDLRPIIEEVRAYEYGH